MRAPILVLLCTLPLPAQETPLPDFDTEKHKASFVLTHTAGKPVKASWPLILDLHGAIAPSRRARWSPARSGRSCARSWT